ncbi:hypothetical protein B0042_1881 [Bifidobacterium adolescentis]|nr:hypothetical protein B0042_1881 [Bifidobacterium adolescentis]
MWKWRRPCFLARLHCGRRYKIPIRSFYRQKPVLSSIPKRIHWNAVVGQVKTPGLKRKKVPHHYSHGIWCGTFSFERKQKKSLRLTC